MRDEMPPFQRKPPLRVAVFGAGITGLTAAHELVERGFEVEVYEPEPPSLLEEQMGGGFPCNVGGIARTQWSRVDRPDTYALVPDILSTQPIELEKERELARKRVYAKKSGDDHFEQSQESSDTLKSVKDLLADLAKTPYGKVKLELRGYVDTAEWRDEQAALQQVQAPSGVMSTLPESRGLKRARSVKNYLENTLKVPNEIVILAAGLGSGTDFTVSEKERRVVTFHIIQDYIPGEHGFRFFPTMYHNLRDTMKRTPVPVDETEAFVESHRTVFDNLVPAPNQAIFMNPPRPSYTLPRRPVTSVQEFFDLLVASLDASGFTFTDIHRFTLKLFKYMTSCAARRKEYEEISWWDFIEGHRYSKVFQHYMKATPQALVAFQPTECDARTYGNITLQLMRDQLLAGEVVDGVLNGPTSLVWLYPWRRYLESQGVRFRRGKLIEFEVVAGKVFPVVVLGDAIESHAGGKPVRKTVIASDYYVVALSLEELKGLLLANPKLEGADFDAVRKWELGDEHDAWPKGAMQHLSGIQFYFPTVLDVLEGHAMYADSEWGLSSISQPQFWTRKRGWWDGYRSVLTVGIGNWHADASTCGPVSVKSGPGPKWAWHQDRDTIAKEIWHQIWTALPDRDKAPVPILYHLDQGIVFKGGDPKKTPDKNKTRMLMNLPGTQDDRPGRVNEKKDHEIYEENEIYYDVHYGSLVLAGTFMKTYFRLTTMEAANESARHAVNAILEHAHCQGSFSGDHCRVENAERHELPDLQYFIDLDAKLCDAKLPHLVDILSPNDLPREWLTGQLDLTPFLKLVGLR